MRARLSPRMTKRSANWSIALNVLLIFAGATAMIVPIVGGVSATVLLGWVLAFSGVVHMMFGRHALGAGGFIEEVSLGLVYGATGTYLLLRSVASISALFVGLAIYLIAEASVEFLECWRLRRLHGVGWIAFDAFLVVAIAAAIWIALPPDHPLVIGALIGLSMGFSGISRLMLVLAAQAWNLRSV